jgi:hypothetical protein
MIRTTYPGVEWSPSLRRRSHPTSDGINDSELTHFADRSGRSRFVVFPSVRSSLYLEDPVNDLRHVPDYSTGEFRHASAAIEVS